MQLPPPIGDIKYLYVDDQIIVVDKPANMLSVPGNTPEKQDCLISHVNKKFANARIVHRLDFCTSGLMVIGQNKEAHRELSRQFQERETKKIYIAKVYGNPEKVAGKINLPVRCDWERRPRQIVDHELGKRAETLWRVLGQYNNYCRMKLTPVTGRTHQLRVHMQAIGHPILGDEFYAHKEAFSMAERLTLHAQELTFKHPSEKELVLFKSNVPF